MNLSATLKINEISKNLENEGKEVIKFGFGQSPFNIPDTIVDELKKMLSKKAIYLSKDSNNLERQLLILSQKKTFNSEQIIIGPGSKELMFLLHMSFEGEIILPSPSWVSYKPQSLIADNKYHWISTTSDNNWYPTAEILEELVSKDKNKNYLLILNSPNNPSGQVCKNFKEISEIIEKYKIIVLSDEIYSDLSFEKENDSIFNYCPSDTIISSGLSKWCGAGGWRLGYFLIPEELNHYKNSIKILASETFSSVSAPIQFAAIKAFEGNHSEYLLKSRKILNAVGNYVYKFLKSNNVSMNKPMGGFYLMPEFLNKNFNSSSEMCSDLLKKKNVAILPGSDFGFDKERLISRLSYTDFDGKNFISKINSDTIIDFDTIELLAPKVVEGVKRINDWVENA